MTKPRNRIDRSSYEPAYVQIANQLRLQIARGEFQAGDQLPTEAELRETYRVSPMTVRRAISLLLDQGAVSTTRGRGTFVRPASMAAASFDLTEFHDMLADDLVTVQVLEARVIPAAKRAAGNLGLPEGTRVVSIRRLLQRGEEALFYHRESLIYDPRRPTVEAELGVTALRDLFEGSPGRGPKRGRLTIHASVLTSEEATQLGATPGEAALVIEHVFYDYDDSPISWGRFVCKGQLLQFNASVGPQAPDGDGTQGGPP